MRRAVIVVLDGLRRDLLCEAHTPNLMKLASGAAGFTAHRSVFPSATRVASSSLATGCFPGRHELQGNSCVLIEDGRLVLHDAGRPDFLAHKRRVTGRSLAVPTLAERTRDIGGAIIFANVSPGASYTHDPDGHGFVYHRAGSFGPGRVPVADERQLKVTPDIAGDRIMTERFIAEALGAERPALAVLWMGDPDATQHLSPLGSPQHLAALKEADRHAGMVIGAVDRLREAGDDVLMIVTSDHGHQTVSGVIDIEAEFVEAGLKQNATSSDVISASNGTSALIYVDPDLPVRQISSIHDFLATRKWAGRVIAANELSSVGQATGHGLSFAVSMRATEEVNEFGIAGMSLVAKPHFGKPDRFGCGQHGGLGRQEQSPFLMCVGPGFSTGINERATSVVDIAPTVLSHLRLEFDGLDGHPLQAADVQGRSPAA
jgi:Type I phosphodiesterase / nucleotide pyrophosphatase